MDCGFDVVTEFLGWIVPADVELICNVLAVDSVAQRVHLSVIESGELMFLPFVSSTDRWSTELECININKRCEANSTGLDPEALHNVTTGLHRFKCSK